MPTLSKVPNNNPPNQTWRFTEEQFKWLVDIIENKTPYTNSWELRGKASELIRRFGYRGWYDMGGRVDLMALRQSYIEEMRIKKTANDILDNLPF